ncbi:MAG: M48 family metalloprotease [Promethearchaeia archaeon]
MKKGIRLLLFILFLLGSLGGFLAYYFLLNIELGNLIFDWIFWLMILSYFATLNEFFHFVRLGKRSEMSDLVVLVFMGLLIGFFTRDLMTALFGSFSIYLWFGIYEIREYPIINKILIISLVTYNIIFVAGLISFYLNDQFFINTAFSFSFWIILGLGFLLFGRKYIVVWRFMSPNYLTLFLYIIAWIAVIFVDQYTFLNFNSNEPLLFNLGKYDLTDFLLNIYSVLIIVNWIIYFSSGPILDKMLGIKRTSDERLKNTVEEVKKDLKIKRDVKVGFGKYPILNAMAYGSFLDQRIAIIAEGPQQIPKDELKGIVAHELSHTKGNHTFILTIIACLDLIVRMLLGLPATYYDYTFGDPRIPMIAFIFLNISIAIILYIFVRILEGKADLISKEAGYAEELAKALYNLESFYATGREIGLNTMLLCDEKITENNQQLDYLNTAQHIHESLIQPSKLGLLSNLLNSHPPTYYRVAAILDDQLKPGKEALLPFICLSRSQQKKYAKKFENAREKFDSIATNKFKSYFGIADIKGYLNNLNKSEIYKNELHKTYLFKHKVSDRLILGELKDVEFSDSAAEPDHYIIKNLNSREREEILNKSLYSKEKVDLDAQYYLTYDQPLILKDIELDSNIENANYIFMEPENEEKLKKPLKKVKLRNSIKSLEDLVDKDVFFKSSHGLEILKCVDIEKSTNFEDTKLTFQGYNKNGDGTSQKEQVSFTMKELVIRPNNIGLNIRRSEKFRENELKIIEWLIKNDVRSYVYLKKPVNNLEIGYIRNLEKPDSPDPRLNYRDQITIEMENIFNEDKRILYNKLEAITFTFETAMIQKKAETSLISKLGYYIINKFKPDKYLIV